MCTVSVSLVGSLIGHFSSCIRGFISLSVCNTIGSRPLTMLAGPIVVEVIGGLQTNPCLCEDNIEPDLRTGRPPLDAPRLGGGGAEKNAVNSCSNKIFMLCGMCLGEIGKKPASSQVFMQPVSYYLWSTNHRIEGERKDTTATHS